VCVCDLDIECESESVAVTDPTMWRSLQSVWTTRTLEAFWKQLGTDLFRFITRPDDTGVYFIAVLGFKLFCLKVDFYTTVYNVIIFIIIIFVSLFIYLSLLTYLS